jgi:hypothetical protein
MTLLRERGIHHLPVVRQGRLVGDRLLRIGNLPVALMRLASSSETAVRNSSVCSGGGFAANSTFSACFQTLGLLTKPK